MSCIGSNPRYVITQKKILPQVNFNMRTQERKKGDY